MFDVYSVASLMFTRFGTSLGQASCWTAGTLRRSWDQSGAMYARDPYTRSWHVVVCSRLLLWQGRICPCFRRAVIRRFANLQEETVLAAPFWKQRCLPREDLASVVTNRCSLVADDFAVAVAMSPSHRRRRYVHRLSIPFRVISAGRFYFANAILFYFIVSSAVSKLCSVRLWIHRFYSCNA